ncbi:MAG TPA: hypothetical protein VFG57_10350 [Gaiella sp.]|nr:hypothetical protein [Gaiella sp.]
MKDQSHKDEMSAAIRGDFQRLRDRGVAATLAPRHAKAGSTPADVIAEHEEPGVPDVVTALAEPVTEPQADESDDIPDAGRHGFLARLLGR